MSSVGILHCEHTTDHFNGKQINKIQSQSISIGNILLIGTKFYILTCFHCVKNTMKITFITLQARYACAIKFFSDEFDLALVEILDSVELSFEKYLSIKNFMCEIPNINDQYIVNILGIEKVINNLDDNKIVNYLSSTDIIYCTNITIRDENIDKLTVLICLKFHIIISNQMTRQKIFPVIVGH